MRRNADGLFRQDIIPIWNLSPEHIQKILDVVYTNTIIYFLNPFALTLLGALLATSIILWRKTSTTLLSNNIYPVFRRCNVYSSVF